MRQAAEPVGWGRAHIAEAPTVPRDRAPRKRCFDLEGRVTRVFEIVIPNGRLFMTQTEPTDPGKKGAEVLGPTNFALRPQNLDRLGPPSTDRPSPSGATP